MEQQIFNNQIDNIIKYAKFLKPIITAEPILVQCHISIPPENGRNP